MAEDDDEQQPEDEDAAIPASAQYAEGELPTISRAEYERAWRESEAPQRQYVSDPALLAQLNAPQPRAGPQPGRRITDPNLLAQLNAPFGVELRPLSH